MSRPWAVRLAVYLALVLSAAAAAGDLAFALSVLLAVVLVGGPVALAIHREDVRFRAFEAGERQRRQR